MNELAIAEQSVLGSIFLEGDLIKDTTLEPKHFEVISNQIIFKAMRKLDRQGEPVDIVSVMMELGDLLEQKGGISYINNLADSIPSTANFNYYCEKVLEAWKLREARKIAQKFNETLQNDSDIDSINEYVDKLRALEESDTGNEFDLNDKLLHIFEDMQQEKGDLTGIDTGYTELNNLTSGLQTQDFVVVGARPAMGKTAFALNIGASAADSGTAVGIFSLEMSDEQLLKRMASSKGNINGMKMKNARKFFDVKDWNNFSNAIGMLNKLPLEIWDKPGITMSHIWSQVKKFKRKHQDKKCLIIIDYLQLITGDSHHKGNRMQEIAEISRKLKNMARELDVCVVALSQLSRAVEQRQDKRPMLSDLRESGQIEQDADLICFLYRDDYYNADSEKKNITEVIAAKNRNGPVVTVELAFIKEFSKFVNLERRFEEKKKEA